MLNCNGVPDVEKDPSRELKLAAIVHAVLGGTQLGGKEQCMFAILCETHTASVASRVSNMLSGYTCFSSKVEHEGRKGHGVAILVHNSVAGFVQRWAQTPDAPLQAVWLRVQGVVFGVEGDVMLGGCYVPPQGPTHTEAATEERFCALRDDIDLALSQCSACLVAGDFNAWLGSSNEFDDECHPLLVAQFPELGMARAHTGSKANTNFAGRLLRDCAGTVSQGMIITTGRGRGDRGEPTCMNLGGKLVTRTEHALMTSNLYTPLLESCVLADACVKAPGLDHVPLRLSFEAPGELPGVEGGGLPIEHTCGQQCQPQEGSLHLKPLSSDQQRDYGKACADSVESMLQQFEGKIREKDAVGALGALIGVVDAAADQSGQKRQWRCPLRRRGVRNPVVNQPWFDARYRAARKRLQAAISAPHPTHVRRRLRDEYVRLVRRSKRSYVSQAAAVLLSLLCQRHPDAHKEIRGRVGRKQQSSPSHISIERWAGYISQQFCPPPPEEAPVPPPPPEPPPPRFQDRERHLATRALGQQTYTALGRRNRAGDREAAGRQAQVVGPAAEAAPLQAAVPEPGPSLEWFTQATRKAISRLDPKSAAGFDGIPAAYVKYACVQVQQGSREVSKNVLVPLLAQLFSLCHAEKMVPESWKVARLSPLFKNKGHLLDPNSYRMLAVSSVFYRLYANVMRQLATEWAVREKKVPDTQFGFYPGRDTVQPAYILRHVVQSVRHAASQEGSSSRVFVAFMDFTQAYDRIDRAALWAHLESIGMPQHLLGAIKGMYENDTYILVDGGRQTQPIHPTRGVKQGCPLSPLLFALYINDFESPLQAPSLQFHGVPLRHGSRKVSHIFYADDLVLMSLSEAGLNAMLGDLQRYAVRKGLTVNAAKSEVVVFGTRSLPVRRPAGGGVVQFKYAGAALAVKSEFKYLGMLFQSSLCMQEMQAPRARGLLAAIGQVTGLARELGLARSPWAMLKLFQTYATSAGMYGCQLWGSRYMQLDRMFKSDVSRRHLRFIKRQLGVPVSVPNWTALCEANCRPFHYYWVRAICRFQARILSSNSQLLVDVAKADAALAAEGSGTCWSAEVGRGLESIGVQAGEAELGRAWCAQVFSGEAVNRAQIVQCLEKAYLSLAWEGCAGVQDVRDFMRMHQGQEGSRSKHVTYYCWFKGDAGRWPEYLSGLPCKAVRAMKYDEESGKV